MNNTVIHIPFDGFGKNTREAAEIIGMHLKFGSKECISFIIPTQWAWNIGNLLHPESGVVSILNNDKNMIGRYSFSCIAKHGEIGVTATPF